MKLYSSTFIGIILAFLMFMGKSGQSVEVIQDPNPMHFKYVFRQEESIESEKIHIEIFDGLMCKNCTNFVQKTLPKIKNLEQENDEIELHLYFIPNINDEIYFQAAMSLKCAADQEQFWGMYEKIHEFKNDLNKKSFIQFAKELELNSDAIQECIKEEIHLKSIEEDIKYSSEKSILFKPTILINEFRMIGDQPFENIQKIINDILREKEEEKRKIFEMELDGITDLEQEIRDSGAFDL